MLKIEHIEVFNLEGAIRGMRNPLNSWDKSDSGLQVMNPGDVEFGYEPNYEYIIGPADLALMRKLVKAGSDHRKFMRQIMVSMDITAPRYWWEQFATYRVGVVQNSTSTMHRLTHRPLEMSDFSFEHLIGKPQREYFDVEESFTEIFVPVKGHEKYSVSNKGRVYSDKRGCFLKPCINSSDYKKVVLDKKNFYVHRLVASAFCENPNELCEVNHKDGNKWNNNYTNLEWVSKSENAQHAFDMGLRSISGYTRYKVSKAAHRFSDSEIAEIFGMYHDGMTKQEIAEKVGCCSSIICNILNGATYREIEMTPYDTAKLILDNLNQLRDKYIETNDMRYWRAMIQLLPQSYNQTRTVTLNYEVLLNMYHARRNHKLDEWHVLCDAIEEMPYFREICLEVSE